MKYLGLHIKTIIATYNGTTPLTHFLKGYFKQYPILGSRDRKILSTLAYTYYRIGKGTDNKEWPDTLMATMTADKQYQPDIPDWLRQHEALRFNISKLFPYDTPLSNGITREEWLRSMLTQPALFIRIRKNKDKIVNLLSKHNIVHHFISDHCLSLPNGAKIDDILPKDSYVVQDASSQKTGEYFHPVAKEQWYDCCSGAGGKSLLLKDILPSVQLTVTDIRENIIHNLKERFRQYGLPVPETHVTNVSDKEALKQAFGVKKFDHIICDVPCSGSGTWARTPEQMYFFDAESINKFSILQEQIATNAAGLLKEDGTLIYITCSVFKQENEEVVAAILKNTGKKLIEQKIIKGIDIQADSMFIAIIA